MKIVNRTLLFLATLFCCLDSVKASTLLQDTIRDATYQLYPLGVACRDNDMAAIKRLLAGKDEPMAMGNDYYEFDIFYTAIYFDKEEVLKYALTRYKDINNRLYSDEYGLTLLTYACKLSNVKLAKDSNGNTPLALAKEIGAKEVEDLLLQWKEQQKK